LQVENFSTICWQRAPQRNFEDDPSRDPAAIPVVILDCPRAAMDELRRAGIIHTGYWRNGDDVDVGVAESLAMNEPQRTESLGRVIDFLRSEAAGFQRAVVGLYANGAEIPYSAPKVRGRDAAEVAGLLERLGWESGAGSIASKLEQRKQEDWSQVVPAVFYHVAMLNNWRQVVREQCDTLASVGLTSAFVGVVGGNAAEPIAIAAAAGVALRLVAQEASAGAYEFPTLRALWRWAGLRHPAAALYLHTKGVSRPDDRNKILWRRLMMRELVEKWREHTPKLKQFDAIGVDWQESAVHPHFSGNFWLARSDWLAALPHPSEFQRSKLGAIVADNPWERVAAEMWLSSRRGIHIESLVCRNENLWAGDNILRFEPLPAAGCARCGSPAHVILNCPIPEDLTVENSRAALLAAGCCDPPR
jgi:hypothetical protein